MNSVVLFMAFAVLLGGGLLALVALAQRDVSPRTRTYRAQGSKSRSRTAVSSMQGEIPVQAWPLAKPHTERPAATQPEQAAEQELRLAS